MKQVYLRALYPVVVFIGLIIILYSILGGDKAMFAFQLFSLPWSVLLEFDPYAPGSSSFQKLLAENYSIIVISGLFLNALIIYSLSVLVFRRHNNKELSQVSGGM